MCVSRFYSSLCVFSSLLSQPLGLQSSSLPWTSIPHNFHPSPNPPTIRVAQEELVLAALRIEALQVAKNISQCPSLSTLKPQVLRWTLHRVHLSACSKSSGWPNTPECMSVFQPAPETHRCVTLTAKLMAFSTWWLPPRHSPANIEKSFPSPATAPTQLNPTHNRNSNMASCDLKRQQRALPALRPLSYSPFSRACFGNAHVACSLKATFSSQSMNVTSSIASGLNPSQF